MIQAAKSRQRRIRYAVVGLGAIAQQAVLPGFANARNSEVVALISDDPSKLSKLARTHDVEFTSGYEGYEECLQEADVDAVFICLPNHLHCEYTMRAARVGVNVLCEKPMAVSERECRDMLRACDSNGAKLMVAYRLHFDRANLEAIRIAQSGKLGDLKYFSSLFSMQVKPGNIRVRGETGGGTLLDIGIYCINAARYLFRSEPMEVSATSAWTGDPRFEEVDEMTSATLRFPNGQLATFLCSFGASDINEYRLVGSKGDLCVEPAYEYAEPIEQYLTIGGKTKHRSFAKHDQFGAEIEYFSRCILEDRQPEPSGEEGLADVRIIEALYRSAREHRPVALQASPTSRRPDPSQAIEKPARRKPKLVNAEEPTYD
jgi:predicted dehydrogenase